MDCLFINCFVNCSMIASDDSVSAVEILLLCIDEICFLKDIPKHFTLHTLNSRGIVFFSLKTVHEECGGQAGRKNRNYLCSTFQHKEFSLTIIT